MSNILTDEELQAFENALKCIPEHHLSEVLEVLQGCRYEPELWEQVVTICKKLGIERYIK